MTRDVALWLCGMVAAIRHLTNTVEKTIRSHCPEAANELKEIEFACNRTEVILDRE